MSADVDEIDVGDFDAEDSDAEESDGDESDGDESDSGPGFPTPPRTVADGADRTIRLRVAGDPDRAALAGMYDDFGVGDRAQGVPPADSDRRSRWLDAIGAGIGVLAEHADRAVGHGVLLSGGPGHELALFVHPDYRGAGVGTALLDSLLGRGRAAGVERVWLSVRRGNRPAVRLYRNAGFSPAQAAGELEMELEMRRTLR